MTPVSQPPHLIHVGFPKCGSTWLQQWFGRHPEIAYCWNSFGGESGVSDFVQGFIHPAPHVRCRVTSEERLIEPSDPATDGRIDYGELGQRRDRQVAIAHALARRYPEARILMVTRNHAELLRSGYSEMVRQGGTVTDADLDHELHAPVAGAGHLDFDFAVALYRGLFGERLLVLPMEWLEEDPAAFVGAIAAFAGVSPLAPQPERANPSLSPEQLYWYPRLAKLISRIRPGRFGPGLRRLHIRAIARGWWNPLIALLRLVAGRRVAQIEIPPELLAQMAQTCDMLVTLPHHVAYRDRYLG